MRILFLGTDLVWPPDSGGRVRTMSQLRVLSSLEEVVGIRMLALAETAIRPEDRAALLRELPKLDLAPPVHHAVHLARHPRFVPRVVWLRAVRGVPYVAAKWESPAMRAAIAAELSASAYDAVWLNGLGVARYLPLVRRTAPYARVVLDQHNVESDRFAQFADRQRGALRLLGRAEWRAARSFERDVLRAVDAVAAISDDDARAYAELAGIAARVVPQVVAFTRRPAAARAPRFCWIGNLTWSPNVHGLDWFCGAVWPLVRERLPDARLEIVGSGLPERGGRPVVPPAWRGPGIEVAGTVADLAPVYARAVALAAPIAAGAGIRIKLLEAFRHGLPVVTTPAGASGLPIQSGREAFVESAPDAFAERLVLLAGSAESREALREAAYAFLEVHHRPAAARAAVSALLGCGPEAAAPARATEAYSSSSLRTDAVQP